MLVSAVPPFMLQTDDNPGGVPIEVFDGIRAGSLADRSQLYRDLADGPFFGNNREGATSPQGIRDAVLAPGPAVRAQERVRLDRGVQRDRHARRTSPVDVPTLVIHGDDDQVVPFASAARRPRRWSQARG